MKKDNVNQFDMLIAETIEEEMNGIHITDEEIKQQWMKFQEMNSNKKVHRKINYKKAVVIIIGALVGFTMMNLMDIEISAWRMPNIVSVFTRSEDKVTVERTYSVGEGIEIIPEEEIPRMVTNYIEEVRDMISFNFKELPFHLEEAMIEGDMLHLNYINDEGEIRLFQMPHGLEFAQTIHFRAGSEINEVTIDGVSYTIVRIIESRTKVIWSSFGISHTMDIDYPIEFEEVIDLLKAME
ncbi:hypothetical protein Amet_1852 [Alkaliphilus metalliredigens QYMF]|uniref:DUF4367 domain-containing protein n=1 Tax=Alkaliphilus metalliredigens (strain QYMF) TaxID=293826 RepID=A6TPA3_ALKMQ|nr:hypothetical protein [Alkaliphilus metalliredigens]ABR48021.1 hypothetical protein Amet_1852 [Alkaliphilus metalliredigens QYMF]